MSRAVPRWRQHASHGCLTGLLFCCLLISPAKAQSEKFELSIPPGAARAALSELARQTATPLLYLHENLGMHKAHGILGVYSLEEALVLMFAGTGIKAEVNGHGVIAVSMAITDEREDAAGTLPDQGTDARFADVVEELPQSYTAKSVEILEVAVTGSRIRQGSGMTAAIPVTEISQEELEVFAPGSTIAEQMDALPQFFQTQTAQRGGAALVGSAGGSFLNMRGMGPARTLVLLDGARVVPGDRGSTVNVDTLPSALVKRVDVVTGGASAAYGADALAGVVNFVLDREFEGYRLETSTGVTEKGDGENWQMSFSGGRQLSPRLHLIGSLEVQHITEIERGPQALDNFQRWGWVANPAWNPADPPGTQPRRLTMPNVHSTLHTPAGLINQPDFAFDRFTFTADGSAVRPFIPGDINGFLTQSGGPEAINHDLAFNGGPYGAEVERRSAFLGAKYALNDGLEVFAQLMLGRIESNQHERRGNPFLLGRSFQATIFRENAFLPETVHQAMEDAGLDAIRLDKLGQIRGGSNFGDEREELNTHQTRSLLAGFDLKLAKAWQLRASWQRGEAEKRTAVYGLLRVDRLFLAMDAVRDPATGAIVCNVQLHRPTEAQLRAATAGTLVPAQAGLIELPGPVGLDDSVRDCVPLNIFGHGNASRAAAEYVTGDKIGRGKVEQDVAEALLSGELFKGWGAGPASMALGLSWREQSFRQDSSPAELDGPPRNAPALGIRGIPPGFTRGSTSLFQFAGVPVINGSFEVWEGFAEIDLPLWEAESGFQHLGANLAYRVSDYSLSGTVGSWKIGLDAGIVQGLRFRATRSRDVREATFSERFDAQNREGSVNDPALGGAELGIATLLGGNPGLDPEKADTLVLGLVYQPPWLRGLQLSADWYDIDLSQAIGQLGVQRIVDGCFAGQATLCARVSRNSDGDLLAVNNSYLNIAAARTRGVDLELQYAGTPDFFRERPETFRLRLLAGHLLERSETTLGKRPFDFAGGLNTPEWTANATAAYTVGPYTVQVQQRYYDSTTLNLNWQQGIDIDDNSIASSSTTNLGFSYSGRMNNGAEWGLNLDITNLWDREPPIVPFSSQSRGSQVVSNNFDVFGRRYQLSFHLNF
ncbi:MAG: TonB-dependent receptor [Pseudomonadales bacterium]|nr:TonB-dependent receptor [Pseudomonadales bacterium]